MREIENISYDDVKIPFDNDELGAALSAWDFAISEWKKAEENHAVLDASFKAFEASTKAIMMNSHKMSATASETYMRSGDLSHIGIHLKDKDKWESRLLAVSHAKVRAEEKKKQLRLAEARWETQRTREASLRQVR